MDEQQDKEQQPDGVTGGEPAIPDDAGTDSTPEPGLQQDSSTGGEAPDAIKAMTGGETPANGGEAAGADSPDAMTINEPSMDFSQPVPAPDASAEVHRAEFPQFGEDPASGGSHNIGLLMDVKLPVSIELGRTTLSISDILEWGQGSVIELDKLAGEPVDLLVNNKLVARGEVVVIDEKFGMRITALVAEPAATPRA